MLQPLPQGANTDGSHLKQHSDLEVQGYWQKSKISGKVPSGNNLSIILQQTKPDRNTGTQSVQKMLWEGHLDIPRTHLTKPLRQSKFERDNGAARNHTTLTSINLIDLFPEILLVTIHKFKSQILKSKGSLPGWSTVQMHMPCSQGTFRLSVSHC